MVLNTGEPKLLKSKERSQRMFKCGDCEDFNYCKKFVKDRNGKPITKETSGRCMSFKRKYYVQAA